MHINLLALSLDVASVGVIATHVQFQPLGSIHIFSYRPLAVRLLHSDLS